MKNTSLALFAALILLGWTSLAVGVISAFAGQPDFSTRAHRHGVPPGAPQVIDAPMFSDRPACPGDQAPDASVPCEA